MIILENQNMGRYTTIGIGANAKILVIVESAKEITDIMNKHPNAKVIGNGSNILVANKVDIVIKLGPTLPSAKSLTYYRNKFAVEGKSGMEFSIGIPATLGGAIKTNAGGKYGSMSDVISTIVCLQNGKNIVHKPVFGYRHSDIEGIILDAQFKLRDDDPQNILSRSKDILYAKSNQQPLSQESAGCIFKNALNYSASYLIEESGFKGKLINNVQISGIHANFFHSTKTTTVTDILKTIDIVKEKVLKEMDIELIEEIEIW